MYKREKICCEHCLATTPFNTIKFLTLVVFFILNTYIHNLLFIFSTVPILKYNWILI